MITEEEASKKVGEGWIRSWVVFEALGINESATKDALEVLTKKLEDDARVRMYKKCFGGVNKVEKPIEGVEVGYSLTCEVNLVSKTFDNLSQIAIEYGPSAVEIIEPDCIKLKLGEAQSILNSISQMMHRLAASGVGGIVFMKGDQ
jgi:hypothetical protein